jgi:hypothetical protein
MKLDLLTNATVVDDAIRFVSQKSKEKVESMDSCNENSKESREPDYDHKLEEEQEEETEEITTNHVF